MIFRLFAIMLPLLFAAGCAAGGHIVSLMQPSAGVHVERGIPYGRLARQKYDFYQPAGADSRTPLVVFFYGGSWRHGSRADYGFVGDALARRGIAVAIPDYRLYPQAVFPAFVDDGADAVAAIVRQKAHGRPVFLMGHSAGAQIAALLDLDRRYLGSRGVAVCRRVAGFIGLAGPYDLRPLWGLMIDHIFPPALRHAAQPIDFAAGRHPPSLILQGGRDVIVKPSEAPEFAAALRRSGNSVTLKVYPDTGHLMLVGSLSAPMRQFAPTLRDVVAFIRAHERAPADTCR